MKGLSVKSKILAFGMCATLIAGACAVPLCYVEGEPFASLSPSLSTAADEVTIVETNKLGRDLAEPVFRESKERLAAQYEADLADFEARASLSEAYATDFTAWLNDDGTINDIDSPTDLSGSGTEADPYVIYTVRGWLWFLTKSTIFKVEQVDGNQVCTPQSNYIHASLGNDLDFAGYKYDVFVLKMDENNNGYAFGGFYGSLNGNGYAIKNLMTSKEIGGLFTCLGCLFLGDAEPTLFVEKKTELRDITIDCFVGGQLSEQAGGIAGAAFNCDIMNCNFKIRGTGANWCFGYVFGNLNFEDCQFNLGGYCGDTNSGVYAAVIFYGYDISSQFDYPELKAGNFFNRCHIVYDVYCLGSACTGCVYMSTLSLSMKNCTAEGKVCSAGGGGDSAVAPFVYGVFADRGASDILLTLADNVNYTDFAGKNVAGIIYGTGANSTIIKNCVNYGDLYCVTSSGGVAGIISTVQGTTFVEDCVNYGNIYSGLVQSGIVGFAEKCEIQLLNCKNFGNMYHHLFDPASIISLYSYSTGIVAFGWGTTITCAGCVNECSFINFSQAKYKELGYVYGSSTSAFTHSGAAGCTSGIAVCILQSTSTPSPVPQSDVTIDNCTAVVNAEYPNMSVSGIFMESMGFTKSTIITNCKAYITSFGTNTDMDNLHYCEISGIALLGINEPLSSQGHVNPTANISNCYCEVNAKSVKRIKETSTDIDFSAPKAISLNGIYFTSDYVYSNIEAHLVADATDLVGEDNADIVRWLLPNSTFIGDFSSTVDSSEMIQGTFNNIVATAIVKLPEDFDMTLITDETVQKILSVRLPDTASNLIESISYAKADSSIDNKIYVQTEGEPNLSGADWFYSESLSQGMPKLRIHYWQEIFIPNQDDVTDRLTSLGFTKYVRA